MKVKFTTSLEIEIEFDQTNMTSEQAISKIMGKLQFPCDGIENVSITEQRITAQSNPEPQYRSFADGDIIEEGDQVYFDGNWWDFAPEVYGEVIDPTYEKNEIRKLVK